MGFLRALLPLVIARSNRTGVVALNVVTAALDADERTRGVEVAFVAGCPDIVARAREARTAGRAVLVAWSFFSPDFPRAAGDLAWVRERLGAEGVWHVVGGVHVMAEPEATLRAGFDLAALGEGEATFIEIVHAVATGSDPRSVAGIAHLDSGRLISHGRGERRPLDAFPAFNARYRRFNPIEITRGCIYACSFCQTPFAFKARFRHRSVENVRDHVAALRGAGGRYVRFVTPSALSYGSDGPAPNLRAVEALLSAVREAIGRDGKIYFGTFPSEVRPEHMTAEGLALLKRFVDNDSLVVGAQSGSERVLAATHRGHGVAEVERAVRLALEAGFRPDVDFLFGLPGETRAEREQSLALAERLASVGARIHNHAFMPLPGTPLAGQRPEVIEPELATKMARMESAGALYGQWRRQQLTAGDLVRHRKSRPERRG